MTCSSTCGSGDPAADHPDTGEPENSIGTGTSSGSSSSESSDDKSDNEQPDVQPLIHNKGKEASRTNIAQASLHPAISSGDLYLVHSLKQDRCLSDKENTIGT